MSELKPCPFCGGEPSLLADVTHSTAWEIECPGISCSVRPSAWEEDKQSAIAAWNTRPQPRAEPVAWMYEREGCKPYVTANRQQQWVESGSTEDALVRASALEAARREEWKRGYCAGVGGGIRGVELDALYEQEMKRRALKENPNAG